MIINNRIFKKENKLLQHWFQRILLQRKGMQEHELRRYRDRQLFQHQRRNSKDPVYIF